MGRLIEGVGRLSGGWSCCLEVVARCTREYAEAAKKVWLGSL